MLVFLFGVPALLPPVLYPCATLLFVFGNYITLKPLKRQEKQEVELKFFNLAS
ncbi:MAG: hypothetical protein ACJ0PY_01755 [Flavobacteriaceae bacterium]